MEMVLNFTVITDKFNIESFSSSSSSSIICFTGFDGQKVSNLFFLSKSFLFDFLPTLPSLLDASQYLSKPSGSRSSHRSLSFKFWI
jgi:hypothetical protein